MAQLDIFFAENKILYDKLLANIGSVSFEQFLKHVQCPILMGKDVFSGELSQKTVHNLNATYRFQPSEDTSSVSKSITQSAYLIRENPEGEYYRQGLITVGRSSKCDITIADYAISKEHAAFRKVKGQYYITDRKSTNGVHVHDKKVDSKTATHVKAGSIIHFGRFGFLLVHPSYFYCLLYATVFAKLPPKENLIKYAFNQPFLPLLKIAMKANYKPQNPLKPSREALFIYMREKLTPYDILNWFSKLPFSY